MKKILVMTSTFPRWDGDPTPPFVYELCKRLGRTCQVHVLAPHAKGSAFFEEKDGLIIHRFRYWRDRENNLADGAILPSLRLKPSLWFQVPPFFLAEYLAARKIVEAVQPDMIHAHWILPQGLVAAMLNRPFVLTSHGADMFGLRHLAWLKGMILNRAQHLTVVSHALRDEAMRLGARVGVDVLPMGVDLKAFCPGKRDEAFRESLGVKDKLILFVGRLSEKKGVAYLIRAMPDVLERFPECRLLIVGDGEQRAALEQEVDRCKIADRVIFAGAVGNAELPKIYASADIFVGPSIVARDGDTEGFGLVFVEAMGSGCLTVASNLPAITDIIRHEETGFLVEPKSSRAISRVLLRILGHGEDFSFMPKRARASVLARFDWDAVAKKYEKILLG